MVLYLTVELVEERGSFKKENVLEENIGISVT